MKRLLMGVAAIVLGFGLVIGNADAAKRVGGGNSVGSQRDGGSNRQATPPAASSAAAGAAAQKGGMSRWLMPLAGLAAGLGLAYLLGDQLGSVMVALLIGVAVIFAIRFFMARRAGPQPAMSGAGGNASQNTSQYTGVGRNEPAARPNPGAAFGGGATAASAVPAGFDVSSFLAQAKSGFTALQSANDRGDLESLREMTTDAMFASLKQEFEARKGAPQNVEVVSLNADLVEVVTEGAIHWASVRFTGAMREDSAGVPERFTEIWNMQKPTDGSAGWLLAGIQQA